jgi:hypothetical protein
MKAVFSTQCPAKSFDLVIFFHYLGYVGQGLNRPDDLTIIIPKKGSVFQHWGVSSIFALNGTLAHGDLSRAEQCTPMLIFQAPGGVADITI